jgi:glucose dehydrogenase
MREPFLSNSRAEKLPRARNHRAGRHTVRDVARVLSLEPFLRAFEARSGKELWKGELPTSAKATPLIYTSARGRHMVAIAAGGHGSQSKLDTKLLVFALRD